MALLHKRLMSMGVLLALGVVGLWLVRRETESTAVREQEKVAADRILPIKDGTEVKQLRLSTPAGEFLLTRQSDGAWALLEPIKAPADTAVVESVVHSLADLRRKVWVGGVQKVSGDVNSAAPQQEAKGYGLNPPRLRVELETQSSAAAPPTTHVLLVGHKNSFDQSLYVQREGASQVALVAADLDYQLNKNLFDWRDKRLAALSTQSVTRVALSGRGVGEPMVLERRGDDFFFLSPGAGMADAEEVHGLLAAAADLRAKAFVSEQATAAQRATYGLANPWLRLALKLAPEAGDTPGPAVNVAEKERDVVFLVGKSGAAYYAGLESGAAIMELSSDAVVRRVPAAAAQWADKHLLHFKREDVFSVILQGEDGTRSSFKRSHDDGQQTDTWHVLSGSGEGQADAARLSSLIFDLWSMRAERLTKLPPSVSDGSGGRGVELVDRDGKALASLRLGEVTQEEQQVHDMVGQRTGWVAKAALEAVSFDPAEYQVKNAAP